MKQTKFLMLAVLLIPFLASELRAQTEGPKKDFLKRAMESSKAIEDRESSVLDELVRASIALGDNSVFEAKLKALAESATSPEAEWKRNLFVVKSALTSASYQRLDRSLKQMEKAVLYPAKLEAFPELGFCCGTGNRPEEFGEFMALLSSSKGKTIRIQGESKRNEPRTWNDENLKPAVVEKFLLSTEFAYELGTAETGKLRAGWQAKFKSPLYRDLIRFQKLKHLLKTQQFERALELVDEIESKFHAKGALRWIVEEISNSKSPHTLTTKVAQKAFAIFQIPDSGDEYNDQINEMDSDHLLFIGSKAHEILLFNTRDFTAEFVLETAIDFGLTENGMDLTEKIGDSKLKTEWLQAIYRRFEKGHHFLRMKNVADEASTKHRVEIFETSDELFASLANAATESEQFESAIKFLESVKDDNLARKTKLAIVVNRQSSDDIALINDSREMKDFREQLGQQKDKNAKDRMFWLVDFTMRKGWQDQDELELISSAILMEFEPFAKNKGARRLVERYLGSFTPPSKTARAVLTQMLEKCEPDQRPQAILNLEKLAQQLEQSKIDPSKIDELFQRCRENLDKLDVEAKASWAGQLAYEFAKHGSEKSANHLVAMLDNAEDKTWALIQCALVFPPSTIGENDNLGYSPKPGGVF